MSLHVAVFSPPSPVAWSLIGAAATLGCAVVTAVYTNFSLRVMPRLAGLPTDEAVSTMQQFNRTALQPPFMVVFFGTAVAGTALAVRGIAAVIHGAAPTGVVLAGIGGVLYLAGFLLTVVYNVPRNEALAVVDPESAGAAGLWDRYLSEWTAANTARAALSATGVLACAAGAVLQVTTAVTGGESA